MDADSGAAVVCTLRAAIEEANTTADADTINFAIPGSGVQTISPASDLLAIQEPVTIDGYSQSGASPTTDTSRAVLKIELDGTNAGDGLNIRAANSTVKGLTMNRFNNRTVWINGSGATGNKVEGNYIGTDASGTQPLGNAGSGVRIDNQASSNPILSNSIFDNDELGIDLVGGDESTFGVTRNDNKDPDKGANRRQNYPVLSSATTDGTTTTIVGKLNSRPGKTFTIQFFSSPSEDPSGFGEGKTFLGQKVIKTNREGKRSFSTTFSPPQPVSPGDKITATATNNLTGDTSEFSKAVTAS